MKRRVLEAGMKVRSHEPELCVADCDWVLTSTLNGVSQRRNGVEEGRHTGIEVR